MIARDGLLLLIIGLVLIVGVIIGNRVSKARLKRFAQSYTEHRPVYKRSLRIGYYRAKLRKLIKSVTIKEWLVVALCAVLLMITAGTGDLLRPAFGGAVAGVGIVAFTARSKIDAYRTLIANELSIFGECVDTYLRIGYPLNTAMQSSALSTPTIKPKVDICIRYWSSGAQKALERLGEDLGVPEAETLIMVLQSIEASGAANARATLEREARNIKKLQEFKIKRQMAAHPIYLVVLKMFPFSASVGIMGGVVSFALINYLNRFMENTF